MKQISTNGLDLIQLVHYYLAPTKKGNESRLGKGKGNISFFSTRLQKNQTFLEVIIDRDAGVYPMVGPGMCYQEMITGDHIPSRDASVVKTEVDSSEMF